MLRLANVKKGDVLYDLGSGDGRIPITAAKKFGIARGGHRHRPASASREANENAKNATASPTWSSSARRTCSRPTSARPRVVTLYLLPDLNVKLRPKLWAELKPGTRIVSHQFDMGTWKPEKTRRAERPHHLLLDRPAAREEEAMRSQAADHRSRLRRHLPLVLHRQAAPGEGARAARWRGEARDPLAALPAQSRACRRRASRAPSTARRSSARSSARAASTRAWRRKARARASPSPSSASSARPTPSPRTS